MYQRRSSGAPLSFPSHAESRVPELHRGRKFEVDTKRPSLFSLWGNGVISKISQNRVADKWWLLWFSIWLTFNNPPKKKSMWLAFNPPPPIFHLAYL